MGVVSVCHFNRARSLPAASGCPESIAPVLGGVEIGAAVVFLVPKLRRIGGYALLAVFAIAAVLHILHGQFDIGPLLVYNAAVLVCVAGPPKKS